MAIDRTYTIHPQQIFYFQSETSLPVKRAISSLSAVADVDGESMGESKDDRGHARCDVRLQAVAIISNSDGIGRAEEPQ